MQRGDISGEAPRTLLVHPSHFVSTTTIGRWRKRVEHTVSDEAVNAAWLYAERRTLRMEAVVFDLDDYDLDALMRGRFNPFADVQRYPSFAHLCAALPYRPDIAGILDPARGLMYGSWAVDWTSLGR